MLLISKQTFDDKYKTCLFIVYVTGKLLFRFREFNAKLDIKWAALTLNEWVPTYATGPTSESWTSIKSSVEHFTTASFPFYRFPLKNSILKLTKSRIWIYQKGWCVILILENLQKKTFPQTKGCKFSTSARRCTWIDYTMSQFKL